MQRVDFLVKENKKDDGMDCLLEKTEIKQANILPEPRKTSLKKDQRPLVPGNLEFFTGFVWCQALIFKSWIEAYDKLVKLHSEKGTSKEIPSLYIDVHEEVFTNLFKSPLYASNLGRMINSSMIMLKNWKSVTQSPNPQNHQSKDPS